MLNFCLFCSNKAETIPIEAKFNVCCVALSPDGTTALLVDESKSNVIKSVLRTPRQNSQIGLLLGVMILCLIHGQCNFNGQIGN